jgi:hypothetical protein
VLLAKQERSYDLSMACVEAGVKKGKEQLAGSSRQLAANGQSAKGNGSDALRHALCAGGKDNGQRVTRSGYCGLVERDHLE